MPTTNSASAIAAHVANLEAQSAAIADEIAALRASSVTKPITGDMVNGACALIFGADFATNGTSRTRNAARRVVRPALESALETVNC